MDSEPNIRNKPSRAIHNGVSDPMLRGYRGIGAALGLILAAHHPNAEAQPKQPNPQERSTRALEGIASRYDEEAKRSEGSRETEQCSQGDDKRYSDLCAQWKAADAAADSAWWAAIGGFASAISALLVLIALWLAFRSNWIARDTAKRQLRAYLTISHKKMTRLVAGKKAEVEVAFGNSGQTPARQITVICEIKTFPKPASEDGFALRPPRIHKGASVAILGPGRECFSYVEAETEETAESIVLLEDGTNELYVFGRLDYEDAFGAKRTTWFRSQLAPNLKSLESCERGEDLT